MRAEDLQKYLRGSPFRQFRITMNSGRTFDIRHPEMFTLTRTTGLVFTLGNDGIVDDYETISLVLIESVQHLETPTPPPQSNGQQPTA